jgi:tyrosine-protein kinase Etk/Wzc
MDTTNQNAVDTVAVSKEGRGQFVDLLALLWRRRGTAAVTFIIIVTVTVVALLVATPEFTARATFVPPPDPASGGLSSVLRDPIGALLGGGSGGGIDRLVGYLDSRTARLRLVDNFNLVEVFRRDSRDGAEEELAFRTFVSVSPEGVVQVDVTDMDRVLAADLANLYVDVADSLYQDSQRGYAGQMRRFLEVRVAENQQNLITAEDHVRDFSEKSGIVALPEQIALLVGDIAQVDAEMRTLTMRIGATREILGSNHASVRQLEIERSHLAVQRRRLMESGGGPASGDPLLVFEEVPKRSIEFLRLQRDVTIQGLIQELLYQQYEMAKLDEARNVSSLVRIDRASPPYRKSWPPRMRILILSGIMAVVWSVLAAWLVDRWPELRDRITGSAERG